MTPKSSWGKCDFFKLNVGPPKEDIFSGNVIFLYFVSKMCDKIIFALFYTFYDLKSCKKLFLRQKIDFNQWMACRAPVCWSKYTTNKFLGFSKSFKKLPKSDVTITVCKLNKRGMKKSANGFKDWEPRNLRKSLTRQVYNLF